MFDNGICWDDSAWVVSSLMVNVAREVNDKSGMYVELSDRSVGGETRFLQW